LSEERLKIAVFIDFDNIEIGIRTTLSRRFDVHTVLEAIKERGEVVTKVAYGNWKRADDYSRMLTEHAVQMVQRNLTPGGDKNGADINLALDALEMAFTRDHINAFVIVGGDSDFIALVEKLKQYDKKVFVVGGRAFTSVILQKNCHEFIAYENLIGQQSPARRTAGKAPVASRAHLAGAMGAIRRALKILTDREVSPQLGLLKSTLLQLDPTFSERDYGAGTFREFIQKLSDGGLVNLKQVDRSLIVELKDGEQVYATPEPQAHEVVVPRSQEPAPPQVVLPPATGNIAGLIEILQRGRVKPRWPMYLRGLKQYLRSLDPAFDERGFGFTTVHDLVRQGQRDGIFRIERNREGILRIFPGDKYPAESRESPLPEAELVETIPAEGSAAAAVEPVQEPVMEEVAAVPAEAEPAPGIETTSGEAGANEEPAIPAKPKRRRRGATTQTAKRKTTGERKPRGGRKPATAPAM
jgi:uncharacterized protein (TIGR00288 family)